MVAQAIEPCDFRTEDWESFSATIQSRSLGTGLLSRIDSDPYQASTTLPMLSSRRTGCLAIQICLAGELTFEHEGATATVSAGQAVVIDTLRANRVRSDRPVQLLNLSLDRHDLGGALRAVEGPALVLSPQDPIAAMTMDLIRTTWKLLPRLDLDDRLRVQQKLNRLVAESLARRDPAGDPSSTHVLSMIYRAKIIAMHQIADAGFGPTQLAERMGITRRYLTTLFQSIDDTPTDYIRRLRMHAAWDLLTDESDPSLVSAVGERIGYADRSQFTKVFRNAYGKTPKQVQRIRASQSLR